MSCLKKYQKILLISVSAFITAGLVIPLIINGIIARQAGYPYPGTKCYYNGYTILNKTCGLSRENFTGILDYKFYLPSETIYRNVEIYCGHTSQEVINYFKINYDNNTYWACWYQSSNPKTGWVGFIQPYDTNGIILIIAGIVILLIYFTLISIYLYIQHRNSIKYIDITDDRLPNLFD
jgi:hypothetical protein